MKKLAKISRTKAAISNAVGLKTGQVRDSFPVNQMLEARRLVLLVRLRLNLSYFFSEFPFRLAGTLFLGTKPAKCAEHVGQK